MEEIEEPYKLWSKQTTAFSAGEPFLLCSFVCGKIQVQNRLGAHDLSLALPVTVEIFEIRSLNDDVNAKLLLTIGTKLQSTDTNHIRFSSGQSS